MNRKIALELTNPQSGANSAPFGPKVSAEKRKELRDKKNKVETPKAKAPEKAQK